MYESLNELLHCLRGNGLNFHWKYDRFGPCIVMDMGRPSELSVEDLTDDPIQSGRGWIARYTDLAGSRDTVEQTDTRRVTAMTERLKAFVDRRNSGDWLANELAGAINRRLCSQLADAYGDRAGFWTIVRPTPWSDPTLTVASYPMPDQGLHIGDKALTGWIASIRQANQAQPLSVYEAPDNPDSERLISAIAAWSKGYPSG